MNKEILCSIISKSKNLKQLKVPNIMEGLIEVWYFLWREYYLAIKNTFLKNFY